MKKTIGLIITLVLTVSIFCQCAYCAESESIKSYMRRNYVKSLNISGMQNFYNYCAACVSYQLMALGITNSYTYFNGNQAYDYFTARRLTTGRYSTLQYSADKYSMSNVLNILNTSSYDETMTPTLLGFNKGTSSDAGQTYGHTLLVYAVKEGIVHYTESMNPTVDENILTLPIDEFCLNYSDNPETPRTEFVYDGAVSFFNTLPAEGKISVPRKVYYINEHVNFEFSAPWATKYYIGINKDGQRVVTSSAENGFTLSFAEPGNYTAYVSCCNVYGYRDSKVIAFTVTDALPALATISVNKAQAIAGEEVVFDFYAENTTDYFLGITAPDGSFNAIRTNGKNTYTMTAGTPGVYTAYVTCVNPCGYIDSIPVTVNVTE